MTREEFQRLCRERIVFLDGATGTNLQKAGMPTGVCPEAWILEHPDTMMQLQKAYFEAGSDIVLAPTFTANRIKLDEFASNWPATVIRTKGVMWLSDDNLSAYVLEQAGRQINAGYSGDWMATGTKKQIEQAKKEDPEFAKNWDETVGDRMIKLVFIGKDMNKEKIIADLDACLVEPKLK